MADTIKIGNLDISAFKVGGADCSIYLGDTKLYPTVKYKYKAKYKDGSEYNIECDTSTGLTSADTMVSSYTDVSEVTVGDCIITLKTKSFSGFKSLESVSLPNSLVNINADAFMGCSSLTSLNIPSTVTNFGNRAFSNCTSLGSINIPNGVTSLPLNCFYNCYSLEKIEIPSGMTEIKGAAFSNCSGLTSVTVLATTPPTISVAAFNNTNDCPIYVPAQSVQTYKSSWIDYASRIQAIPT